MSKLKDFRIQVEDDLRIEADLLQWILVRRVKCKATKDIMREGKKIKKGESYYAWENWMYYGKLRYLLQFLVGLKIRQSKVKTLEEFRKAHHKSLQAVKDLFSQFPKEYLGPYSDENK